MIEIKETNDMVAVNSYRLEVLIRNSERLSMVQEYVKNCDSYVNKRDLEILLGIKTRLKLEEGEE